MYAAVLTILSLWIVARTLGLLVRIVGGDRRARLFESMQGRAWSGGGRNGISLLCRDCGEVQPLGALLAVEYADYEVVVVADSLRNNDSLQRIIRRYNMVAVDGRISGEENSPRVRRMYRSASRRYRRLILLDVATTGERSDFEAAFEVATYDFLLPLWGDERLCKGAVERLFAEISSIPNPESSLLVAGLNEKIVLIPAEKATECGGVSCVALKGAKCRKLYEQMVDITHRRNRMGVAAVVILWVLLVVCAAMVVMGVEPYSVSVVILSLLFVAVAAYASAGVVARSGDAGVGYGDTLYLFCENLLPHIWQIRK